MLTLLLKLINFLVERLYAESDKLEKKVQAHTARILALQQERNVHSNKAGMARGLANNISKFLQ